MEPQNQNQDFFKSSEPPVAPPPPEPIILAPSGPPELTPPQASEHKPRHPYRNSAIMYVVVIVLLFGVFRIGYGAGQSGYSFDAKEFKIVNQTGQKVAVDYSLLWEALEVVNSKYIERDQVDQNKVLYGAISGAVRAAGDEYTEFFDPETLAQFKSDLQGTFSGIGAEIGKRDGNIVVIAPLDDSPAARAGVLPNDIILKVNDEAVTDWNVDETVSRIRGEAGTDVKLTLYRESKSGPFDITIKREQIEIRSVKLTYKEVNGKTIAVLKISRFGDDTKRLLDIAITEIRGRDVDGIVVDLRNDPGGYLNTSVEAASEWLPAGTLVVQEARSDKDITDFTSSGSNRLGDYPTVVLINGGSASAAEILAGALRDNNKAKLIGEKSFGKGSVQELIPLRGDTAVKVTIAKWITPSGKNLNHEGLEPDIKVELTEDDFAAQRDPQMDAAVAELLK
jgi:carboxyl-terminal processing protease